MTKMIARLRHRYPCIAVLAVLSAALLPASSAAQDGGTQSIFSALGAGSRGISLGRSYVSLADDGSAIYWNPATLRNVQTKQITGMYMPLFGNFTDATYTFLGATYPTLGAGSLGLGLQRISSDFQGFDASSVPTGTENYSETQVLVGWAFERNYRYAGGLLATGVSFKIANQKLAERSSTAPGIDLGFRYVPNFAESFSIGVNIQDIVGPDHRLNQESDQTDRTIMAGFGYTTVFQSGSALRLMVQLDSPQRADSKMHFGAEYAFSNFVALRAGMDDGDVTFGLGVGVSGFGLDYAFLNRDTAGSSHPVSFTAEYGQSLYMQRQQIAQAQAAHEQQLIQQAFFNRIEEHRTLAKQNEVDGNLQEALDEWKIVLEYVPGDEEATGTMEAITGQIVKAQERETRGIENRATISAHFSQGLRLYQESDYVRSRAEWQNVLAIDSTHTDAQVYLRRTQDKIDEARALHMSRGVQFEREQRLTEAVSEWNNVEVLDPGNPQAKAAIARIQGAIESQSKDLAQAARRLRIVNLYNNSLQSFNQGDYVTSKSGLEQLLRLEPTHEEAKNLHALATRKLTPLSEEEEQRIRGFYLRGMEFFSKDKYTEAIREWEKILTIDPTNDSVKRNIEEARVRLEQLGQR